MERTPYMGDSGGLLRAAVNLKSGLQLKKLDLSLTMERVIEQLCDEEDTPYISGSKALWCDKIINDHTKCVHDQNKHLVEQGSFLVLKDSPTTLAGKLLQDVEPKAENVEVFLVNIELESRDSVVLSTLRHFYAHRAVFKILEEHWASTKGITCGLIFICRLFEGKYIRKFPQSLVDNIHDSIANGYKTEVDDFLVQCLKVASSVRRHSKLRYQKQLFDHVSALLLNPARPQVQEAALELLNYLVMFPHDAAEERDATEQVVNQKIVGCICESILRRPADELSSGMKQQLYRYQTLVLRPFWHKKVTKVLNTDPLMNDIRKLTHRARRGTKTQLHRRVFTEGDDKDVTLLPLAPALKSNGGLLNQLRASFKRSRSAVPGEHNTEAGNTAVKPRPRSKKVFYSCVLPDEAAEEPEETPLDDLSFQFYGSIEYITPRRRGSSLVKATSLPHIHEVAPTPFPFREEEKALKDPSLSSKAISELTVVNLRYLAEHYEDNYRKWAINKGQSYPFADKITHVVCRVLEVGRPRPIDSPGDGFHHLVLLEYPYFLQELYCEAFALYEKTSKEMRANATVDEVKVLATVQEQLVCALSSITKDDRHVEKPKSMAELRDKLAWINYKYIAEKRRKETNDVLAYDLRTKQIFVDYRAKILTSTLDLIERQRRHFMQQGQHLPKFNNRGELNKTMRDFLALNPKGDQLIVGECHSECQHMRRIPVSDLVDVIVGKQSRFYQKIARYNETRVMKNLVNESWAFCFTVKTAGSIFHNFCAPDATSFAYWCDCFHILLGRRMTSEVMEDELEELLDMEVRLHFLHLEGLPIPDRAPMVPALPPNFNFLSKQKKTKSRVPTAV